MIKKIIDRLCIDRNKDNNKNILEKEPDICEYTVEEKLKGYECIICLEELNKDETISIIKCGHLYHTTCIYTWFLKKRTCPICDELLEID